MSAQVTGTFEPATNGGGGHLRAAEANYRVRGNDIAVAAELIRRLNLRGGETVVGTWRKGTLRNGKSRVSGRLLDRVESINGQALDAKDAFEPFEKLTAIDPEEPIRLETPDGPTSMRVVDLLTPIGFGTRALIAAPPRSGKTVLLKQMAHGIAVNHPDVYMMVLLIDERPEEVTEMKREVRGEVIASSNDEDHASHVRIARLMIEKAKRHVECGENVIVLLDSLTRLSRVFNVFKRGHGRTMSGGLDVGALSEPKSMFGAARNVEHGGSLTIIATALIETNSRMDDVIFSEFKGTGNMEIMLDRGMANRRIWPAIDLAESGTRKEERLLTEEALAVSYQIRRNIVPLGSERAMETLVANIERHPTNADYLVAESRNILRPRRATGRRVQ